MQKFSRNQISIQSKNLIEEDAILDPDAYITIRTENSEMGDIDEFDINKKRDSY